MSTYRPALLLASLVVASVLTCGLARAEVAVALAQVDDDERAPISSYILRITDDSSPLGAWAPVAAPSDGRIVLNATGGDTGDGSPSLVHDATTGLIAVAWSRALGASRDIVISRFDGTAWTAPVPVTDGPDDEVDPRLAVDGSSGIVHVVYQVDAAQPRIEHRQAGTDLATWSDPVVVSAPGDTALRPGATVFEGTLRVVYENHPLGAGVTPRQIVAAEPIVGGTFATEVVATTYHDEPNRPEIHAAPGRLWIDWVDDDGDMAFSRSIGGSWNSPEVEPFADPADRDFGARERIRGRVLPDP